MIIIGAKGLAKEVLEIFYQRAKIENLAFYDDVNMDNGDLLYQKFPIIKDDEGILQHFKRFNNEFTIGIGHPRLRFKLYNKFTALGGLLCSSVSPLAQIGHYDVQIGLGCNIFANSIISNSTTLGKGCIVYFNVSITHDCEIGDFVELSPAATILGRTKIGDFTQVGANATILPGVKVGKNVIIGAGAVVTKDVEDYAVVVGVPAKKIK